MQSVLHPGEVDEIREEVACLPKNYPQTNKQASPGNGFMTKGQKFKLFHRSMGSQYTPSREGSKSCTWAVPAHEGRTFLSWFCNKQMAVAKQRFRVSRSSPGLPLHSGPHPASMDGHALREQAQSFPQTCLLRDLCEQAHTSHHSLCDHSNLDPEDPCLFAGGHSLQTQLPAGELDREFHFNLQQKGRKAWFSHALELSG